MREDGRPERVPLGLFAKLKCTEGVAHVGAGESLFLYTDGVPEATDATLADFTDERLERGLIGGSGLECRALIERLMEDLLGFTQGAPQSDDITMVALRRATS